MRIYNKYVISLVLASCLVNTLLAFFGQDDLEIYFVINIIAYLTITLLHVYLNPRARRALNTTAAVLFSSFMVIVVLKAIEIVLGR
ncbi:hypothetical protein ACFLTO_05970 [Chloroflexota bacterium]